VKARHKDSSDAMNQLLKGLTVTQQSEQYQSSSIYPNLVDPPKEYESIIQKLEGEVRGHIRVRKFILLILSR
jgi:hypothetical protein